MRIIIMGVFVALISLPAYAFPSVVSGSYYHDNSKGAGWRAAAASIATS